MRVQILIASLITSFVPTLAQAQDCSNPLTQSKMTACAFEAYQMADEDLNLAWGMAVDQAKSIDQANDGASDAFETLRAAQRGWISFRDLACEAESTLAFGGSMQPMLHAICLERLTRERTEHLRYFGEVN